MLKRNILFIATGVVAAVVATAAVRMQAQSQATHAVKNATLTATDYAEIQHLYARYAHGIDSKADNGQLYASVFTPDAFFRAEFDNYTSPLENLIARYGRSQTGAPNPITNGGHQTWNVMIEPAPWGAIGRAYMGNGSYYDTIVKTPDGWRFKARNYRWDLAFPSQRRPATPAPAPATQTR